jgi:transcriptional regulator with XRE-family HTH domain
MINNLNNLEAIGARLKEERLAKKLKQDDFAELGGVKRVSQGAYESGKAAMSLDYLLRLSAHDVDIDYVVTGVRKDGSLGAFEQQLLNDFRALGDEEKAALLVVVATMVSGAMKSPDQFMSDIAYSSSQTLHSPKDDYRGPK